MFSFACGFDLTKLFFFFWSEISRSLDLGFWVFFGRGRKNGRRIVRAKRRTRMSCIVAVVVPTQRQSNGERSCIHMPNEQHMPRTRETTKRWVA